jgi:hypothetical protein
MRKFKIQNLKSQINSKSQIQNSKQGVLDREAIAAERMNLVLGACDLFGIWCFEFGA